MANALYTRGKAVMGDFKWDTDTRNVCLMLMKSTYTFDATQNKVSDLTPATYEASGTGYARKNIAAAVRTVNEDDSGGAAQLRVTASSVSWTGLSCGTGLKVVLFIDQGGGISDDANNDLLAYYDTGTEVPINTNGGDVTLNFHATDGAIKIT